MVRIRSMSRGKKTFKYQIIQKRTKLCLNGSNCSMDRSYRSAVHGMQTRAQWNSDRITVSYPNALASSGLAANSCDVLMIKLFKSISFWLWLLFLFKQGDSIRIHPDSESKCKSHNIHSQSVLERDRRQIISGCPHKRIWLQRQVHFHFVWWRSQSVEWLQSKLFRHRRQRWCHEYIGWRDIRHWRWTLTADGTKMTIHTLIL